MVKQQTNKQMHKQRFIIALVAIFSIPFHGLQGGTALQAQGLSADDAYRQGNYAEAVVLYEQQIADGYTSAELYYNLGNAYYRENQMAKSILNYRRALRLNPSMRDAKENLALAESRTTDRIAELPQLFIVRWVDTLCTQVSPRIWRIVWLVLLALQGVTVVCFRLGRDLSLRKGALAGGLVLVVLLALASWLLLRTTARYNAHSEAVVMSPAISVKGSPETQSVDKMILHEGTVVTVSESLSGWYKIILADGTTGWCQSEDIERI